MFRVIPTSIRYDADFSDKTNNQTEALKHIHSALERLSANLISDDDNHSLKPNEPTIARIRKYDQRRTPFISDHFLKFKDR